MNITLDKSKHIIIANAVPTNLKPLWTQKNVSLSGRKPTKYLITLKSRTTKTTNTKTNHTDVCCANLQPACRKFIINDEDVLKGKSMFDSHYIPDNPQLERIDEQSLQSQTTITLENHSIKHSRSLIDINRLADDYSKKLSTKEDSVESTEKLTETSTKNTSSMAENKIRLTGGCFPSHKDSEESIEEDPPIEQKKLEEENAMDGEIDGPSDQINEFFTKVTTDDGNCKRIEVLEEQIEKMHMELKLIRNEIVPPEDLQKYSTLSERLNEINSILLDLKLNCHQVNCRQYRQDVPKIIIQPPKTDNNMPNVCINRQEPRTPILEEAARYPDESVPYSGLRLPRDNCKRTPPPFTVPNRNHFDNYSPDINETPRHASKCSPYRPRQIYAEESPESSESAESSLADDTNTASNCDISPNNVRQWEPTVFSTPHRQRPHQYQHQSCKQDYTRHSLPVTSNQRSYTEEKTRYSAPTTYERKAHQHQTPNQNDHPLLHTPRTFEEEEECNVRIHRASEPHANRTTNQCNKRRRKSAGKDSLFSATDLSSPEVRHRNNNKTYDAIKPCIHADIPLVTKNLPKAIKKIIQNIDSENISLTVILKSNNLYHITVTVSHTGQSLGCVYATETALNRAESKDFFESFLTFFVLNSNNTLEQRNKMFGLLH